jgi:UDP-2-acetamido-2-deoxy-ribo-hexuluronate aminotransferase
MMALGVGAGNKIATAPFSFSATAEVLSLVGANPVLVNIVLFRYNLDLLQIKRRSQRKPGNYAGFALRRLPDHDEINAINRKVSLPVIEDVAKSFGAHCNAGKAAISHSFRRLASSR